MQKKIYVAGMFDGDTAKKVEDAVRAVSGVTSVTASPDKAQVLVDYADDGVLTAINAAISALGVDVLDQRFYGVLDLHIGFSYAVIIQ